MTDENEADNGETGSDSSKKYEKAAQQVILLFGGIRPMSSKVGVAVSTVQGWKERGAIPPARHKQIREKAGELNLELDEELLIAAGKGEPEAKQTEQSDSPQPVLASEEAEKAPIEAGESSEVPSEDAADQASDADAGNGAEAEQELPPQRDYAPQIAAVEPSPAQERGRHSFLFGFLVGAIVLAAGATGAVVTRDLWLPRQDGGGTAFTTAVSETLAELEGNLEVQVARNAAMEGEVARLIELVAELEVGSVAGDIEEDLVGISDDISDLTARLAEFEGELAAGPDITPEDLAGLEGGQVELAGRLASLEASTQSTAEATVSLREDLTALQGDLATVRLNVNDDTALLRCRAISLI